MDLGAQYLRNCGPHRAPTVAATAANEQFSRARLEDWLRSLPDPNAMSPMNDIMEPFTTDNLPTDLNGDVTSDAVDYTQNSPKFQPAQLKVKRKRSHSKGAVSSDTPAVRSLKQDLVELRQLDGLPATDFAQRAIDFIHARTYMQDYRATYDETHEQPPILILKISSARELSVPSAAEDELTKIAGIIIMNHVKLAKELKYHYVPPPNPISHFDTSSHLQSGLVNPLVVSISRVPESTKDDGRPYVKVYVNPDLRTVMLASWIRKQWLCAEWRRSKRADVVEVKRDRSDIILYFQVKCASLSNEREEQLMERFRKQDQSARNWALERRKKYLTENYINEKYPDPRLFDQTTKLIKDPKAANLATAKRTLKVAEEKVVRPESPAKTRIRESDAVHQVVLDRKAWTIQEIEKVEVTIRGLHQRLANIENLPKRYPTGGDRLAKQIAIWKQEALANLTTSRTFEGELHGQLRRIESIETAQATERNKLMETLMTSKPV